MEIMRTVFHYPKLNWYPGHMRKGSRQLLEKASICDVLIEVRDARAPLSSANDLNQKLMQNKLKLVVLNKMDLCSVSYTRKIAQQLTAQGQHVLMFSAQSQQNIHSLIKCLQDKAPPKFQTIGTWALVGGVPNVGKSSLINALGRRSRELVTSKQAPRAKVGAEPCVTRGVSGFKVSVSPLMYVMDSPGIMMPRIDDPERGMKLALVGAIKESIVGVETLCDFLLFVCNRLGVHAYVQKYALERPVDNVDVLITRLQARYNWEETAVCRAILKHYREGKLGKFTLDKINPEFSYSV